jgi:NADH:ubiquinone oxidoreductase subunit 5 (subunit L)/multisubunit Na+/H+ antiporter MnhA subunit
MFFGWEGVGLASYLLIGFWYHKPTANAAALKAFVVNRVGDFGFSLGIFGTFLVFGTVSIPAILEAAPSMAGATFGLPRRPGRCDDHLVPAAVHRCDGQVGAAWPAHLAARTRWKARPRSPP